MRNTGKRLLAMLLCVVICVSLLPIPALAEEGTIEAESSGGTIAQAAEEPILIEESFEAEAAEAKSWEPGTYSGAFQQTEARRELALVNEFRTGDEAWFWNPDNETKTVYNVEGGTYLGELEYDYALEKIAMQRAVEIAIYFSHTRPNGKSCFSCTYGGIQTWGENIANGTDYIVTAEFATELWKETNDPYDGQGHRRNMLNPRWKAIGVGCFEYDGIRYWVQEFSDSLSDTAAEEPNDDPAIFTLDDEGNVAVSMDGGGQPSDIIAFGTCGDDVAWTLTRAGVLTISGTGDTWDYDRTIFYDTPWSSYIDRITSVVIEPEVTRIGERLLSNCESLTNVTIADSVTSIGRYAFAWCMSLPGVTIPDSVTSIEDGAFKDCESLTSVTIPDSVATVGDEAFGWCMSLPSVTIPASVASIGDNAFIACESLTSITFEGSAPSFGDDVFSGVTATAYYPAGVSGWTENVRQNYGGNITWEAVCPEHVPGEKTIENLVPAACTKEGRCDEVICCTLCGEELSREAKTIPALGHTPGEAERENETPATCTEEGSYDEVVTCTVCGEEISRKTITTERVAHTPGEPVREHEIPATTTADGSYEEVIYCTVCEEELSREPKTIPMLTYRLSETELTLVAGKTGTLKVTDDEGKTVPADWSTSNDEIADVDGEGIVTGKKAGKAVITAAINDFSAECEVLVQFADVTDSTRSFYQPVYWALENGITTGTGATTFSPDKSCTRAQIVTFLWRLKGCPEPKSLRSPFTDVTNPGSSFYKPVLWALEKGITTGTSKTTFSPNKACTRAQCVTFLWRALGEPEPSTTKSPFKDVTNPNASFYKAVLWALENGITTGTSKTTFSPNNTCTRGQIVTFLYRYNNLQPDPGTEKVRIGLITDIGGVNDKSFNQTSWEGLQALAAEDSRFEVKYLESKTEADYQTNINTFVDEGYDLMIGVGYMLSDAVRAAAEANPDRKFAIIDDESIDLPNVACLMFAQEQASYLVGLVAGSVTESKTVGYIQGMVFPSMNKFGVGFISGVLAVCPDATVLQYNANNFGDYAGGFAAAKDMITQGADVIYHAAGGTGMGVIEACNEEGIWAIGVDIDQSILAPDHVITSAMKRVDVACQDISKAVADGTFVSGTRMYDVSNGGVDLAPTRDYIPAEVLEIVEQAKADIIAGKIVVPTLAEEVPEFILA